MEFYNVNSSDEQYNSDLEESNYSYEESSDGDEIPPEVLAAMQEIARNRPDVFGPSSGTPPGNRRDSGQFSLSLGGSDLQFGGLGDDNDDGDDDDDDDDNQDNFGGQSFGDGGDDFGSNSIEQNDFGGDYSNNYDDDNDDEYEPDIGGDDYQNDDMGEYNEESVMDDYQEESGGYENYDFEGDDNPYAGEDHGEPSYDQGVQEGGYDSGNQSEYQDIPEPGQYQCDDDDDNDDDDDEEEYDYQQDHENDDIVDNDGEDVVACQSSERRGGYGQSFNFSSDPHFIGFTSNEPAPYLLENLTQVPLRVFPALRIEGSWADPGPVNVIESPKKVKAPTSSSSSRASPTGLSRRTAPPPSFHKNMDHLNKLRESLSMARISDSPMAAGVSQSVHSPAPTAIVQQQKQEHLAYYEKYIQENTHRTGKFLF